MADIAQVRMINVFSKLPDKVLAEIASMGSVENYNTSEVIYSQGERARYLYGILDGQVDLGLNFQDKIVDFDVVYEESIIEKSEIREKYIVVDRIEAGDILAWSALVGPGIFSTTARCQRPTVLFSLPREKLKGLMDRDPGVGYAIMSGLADIISQRRQKVIDKLTELWVLYFGGDEIVD